ncbi:MAG TPA: hypothetical protein VMS99_05850 [Acidimicrobiia bacterium]|nr:hypothetical protein [Acidimicrobiia bacterium]
MAKTTIPVADSDYGFGPDLARGESAIRVWRLQYGPCWCRGIPPGAGSFDFVRFNTTTQNLGAFEGSIIVFSNRVIDGSLPVFLQVLEQAPDPKLVVATLSCPYAARFWEELPVGWAPIEEVLPIDLHIEECVTGNPETLMAGVLGHVLGDQPSVQGSPELAASGRG